MLVAFSRACDDGFTWFPTWRVGTQPVGCLVAGALISGLYLHAPGEYAAVLAVDGPLARGYACRPAEAGVEVGGGSVHSVNEADVVVPTEQTRLRQAYLQQPQALPLFMPLGEVAEQLALIVGNEAADYLAARLDITDGVPGPGVVGAIGEIGGTRTFRKEEAAGQRRLIPAVESIDERHH